LQARRAAERRGGKGTTIYPSTRKNASPSPTIATTASSGNSSIFFYNRVHISFYFFSLFYYSSFFLAFAKKIGHGSVGRHQCVDTASLPDGGCRFKRFFFLK
jgi:hypothetical protein